MELLKRFWYEEEALTAVEYALMLGLLALIVATAAYTMFENAAGVFQGWSNWFEGAKEKTDTLQYGS